MVLAASMPKRQLMRALSLVSFQFQGLDLPAERFLVGETLPEATAGDNTELDLRCQATVLKVNGIG